MMIINRYKIESDGKPLIFNITFVCKLADPYNSVRLVERD